MRSMLTLLVAFILLAALAPAEEAEQDYTYRFETGGVLVYTGKQTNQFKQETGESL